MTARTNKLADADKTWISSILLNAEDDDATITLDVPMDATASPSTYEETIDFTAASTPEYVHAAARAFAEASVRFIRERAVASTPEVACATCTGACCGRVFGKVSVTVEDAKRMAAPFLEKNPHASWVDSPAVKRGIDLYPHGESWNGYVGQLARTSWQGEGTASCESDERPMACVFLDTKTSFCTIYDTRPDICREFTAHDCGHKEEAPQRLITLRRKVLQRAAASTAGSKEPA